MKRTTLALQPAHVAAGARPCDFTYGRWAIGVAVVGANSQAMPNGTTHSTALGRHPV